MEKHRISGNTVYKSGSFLFADAVQQKLDLSSSIKESARIYVMPAEDGAQDAFTQATSELGEMGAEKRIVCV